jgi:hypothetical protein
MLTFFPCADCAAAPAALLSAVSGGIVACPGCGAPFANVDGPGHAYVRSDLIATHAPNALLRR